MCHFYVCFFKLIKKNGSNFLFCVWFKNFPIFSYVSIENSFCLPLRKVIQFHFRQFNGDGVQKKKGKSGLEGTVSCSQYNYHVWTTALKDKLWTTGWMDELWTTEWMDELWTTGWMDDYGLLDEWMNGWTMDYWMNGWTMDYWMNGWTADYWMNVWIVSWQ